MEFIVGQKVTLINGKARHTMIVLGQVRDYVALYDDNIMEVYSIYQDRKNNVYLVYENDGGPSPHYKFKIEEN